MRSLLFAMLSLAIGLGLLEPAIAGPHEDAKAADGRGDYAAELAILKPAAAAGEVWAENNLGNLYASGRGVKEDDAMAAEWYQKAAEKGDQTATGNLMRLYITGRARPQDPAQASQLDSSRALLAANLAKADCVFSQLAAAKNASEKCANAFALIKQGAEAGVPEMEEMLGAAYISGNLGVPQDSAQGIAWTIKAADKGDSDAEFRLGFYYDNGVGVDMDEASAEAWYVRSANDGNSTSADILGQKYEQGNGVSKDPVKSFHWYLKAAEAGLPDAEKKVAEAYAGGRGVALDEVSAYAWTKIGLVGPALSSSEDRDAELLALNALKARLTPQQVSQGDAMAARLMQAHKG